MIVWYIRNRFFGGWTWRLSICEKCFRKCVYWKCSLYAWI